MGHFSFLRFYRGPKSELTDALTCRPKRRSDPGQRGLPRLRPRGRPPAPPPEGTPRLGGAFSHPRPAGYRGAPARGVDVKPSPGRGSGRPRGGRKRPKSPKKGFLAQKPDFWAFSPKMAFFRHFWDSQTSPRGGFYINPSRRGPAVPREGSRGALRDPGVWSPSGGVGEPAPLICKGGGTERRVRGG